MAKHLTYSDFKNIRSGAQTLRDYANGLYATQANTTQTVAKKLVKKGIPIRQEDLAGAQNAVIPSLQSTNTQSLTSQTAPAQKQASGQPLNTVESVQKAIEAWNAQNAPNNNANAGNAQQSTASSAQTAPTAQFTSDSGNKYDLNASNQLQTGAQSTQLQNSVMDQYIKNLLNQAESDNGGKAATREQIERLDQYGADLGNGVHVSNLLSQNTQNNYIPGQTPDVSGIGSQSANSASGSSAVKSSSKSQIPVLESSKQSAKTEKQIQKQSKKVDKQTTTAQQYAEQADRYQKRYEEYLEKANQTTKADIKKKYLKIAESWKKDAETAKKKAGSAYKQVESASQKLETMRSKTIAQEAGGKYRQTSGMASDYAQYLAATNNGQNVKQATKLNALASATAKSRQANIAKNSANYVPTLTQADARALQNPQNKSNYVQRLTQADAQRIQEQNKSLDTSTAAGYSQKRLNGISTDQQNAIRQYMSTLEAARNAAADEALNASAGMPGGIDTSNSDSLNSLAEQQKAELQQKYGLSDSDVKKYMQYISAVDNANENAQQQQEMYQETHTGNRLKDAYQGVLNTVGAISLSPYSTLASGIQSLGNAIDGKADANMPSDDYAGGNAVGNTKRNAVAQTQANIQQNLTDAGHPNLGKAASTVYGVGEGLAEAGMQYAVVNGALNDLGVQDAVAKALTRLGVGKAGEAALTDSAKRLVSLMAQAGANITTNQLADLLVTDAPAVLQNAANGKYQNAWQAAYDLTEKQAESNMGNLFGGTMDALKGNGPVIPQLDTSDVGKRTAQGNDEILKMFNADSDNLRNDLPSLKQGMSDPRFKAGFGIEGDTNADAVKAIYRPRTAEDLENYRRDVSENLDTERMSNPEGIYGQTAKTADEQIPKVESTENIPTKTAEPETAEARAEEMPATDESAGKFGSDDIDSVEELYKTLRTEANKHDRRSPGTAQRNEDIQKAEEFVQKAKDGTMTKEDYADYLDFVDDQKKYLGGKDNFVQRKKGAKVGSVRAIRAGRYNTQTPIDYAEDADSLLDALTERIKDQLPSTITKDGENLYARRNALPADYDQSIVDKLRWQDIDYWIDGKGEGNGTSGLNDRQVWDYYTTKRDYGDEAANKLLEQYNNGIKHPEVPGQDTHTVSAQIQTPTEDTIPSLQSQNKRTRAIAENEGIDNSSDTLTGEIPELGKNVGDSTPKIDEQTAKANAEFDQLGKGSPYDDEDFDVKRTADMMLKYGDGKKRPGHNMGQTTTEEDIPRGNEDTVNRLRETMANRTNPSNPEEYTGRTVTNTIRNTAMDTDEEYQKVMDTVSKHVTQTEKTSFESADRNVSDDFEGSVAKYTAPIDKKTSGNYDATDIDSMFILRSKLNAMARNTDDAALKEQYYQQSMQIAKNLDTIGHKRGQDLQAFSKWSGTYDGAVAAAEGRLQNIVDGSINGATKEKLSNATKQIVDQFNALHKVNPTQDEVNKIVRDALNNCGISQKYISDAQIKDIASQLLSQNSEILKNKDYDALNNQLEFMYSGVDQIKSDTLDRVYDLFDEAQKYDRNSKKYMDLTDQAYKMLATDLNAHGTIGDKWDTWRYLCMLANPKTHIKNITGNAMFRVVTGAKDTVGAVIEKAADMANKAAGGNGIQRTKSILTVGDKSLVDACEQDATDHAWRQLSGSKYFDNPGSKIDENIPAWADQGMGKVLNKLSDLNSNLLEKEDDSALISKYKTALAGYLKANGYDKSIFDATDDASKVALDNARAYAVKAAKEAAFHQDSKVANMLSNLVSSGKNSGNLGAQAAARAVDYVIPFRKTPINILKSALEYSPLEFCRVAADAGGLIGKSSAEKAEIVPQLIDDLSKSLTGSGMMVAGALLSKEGILQVGSDQSDSEKSFGSTTTGRIYPSIKIGGVHVNVSELTPSISPLIYGATFMESFGNGEGAAESGFNSLVTGLGAIADGLTDMTMLSSISDILDDVRYSDSSRDAIITVLRDIGSSAIGQSIPSLGRAIAKSIDSNRRSTYTDKSGEAGEIAQQVNYWKTSIPGLQQAGEAMQKSNIPALQKAGEAVSNEPAIDVWGRERKNIGTDWGGTAGRIAENFAIPVTISKDNSDATDKELYRLHDSSPDKPDDMFHYMSKKSDATFKGEDDDKITLTPKDWTKYQKENGQLTKQILDGFLKTDEYKALSDDDKITAIDNIYKYTKKATQADFGGKDLTQKDQVEMEKAYQKNGVQGIVDYLKQDAKESKVNSDITNAGYDSNDFTKEVFSKGGVKALDKYKDAQAAVKKYANDDNGLELNETTNGMYKAFGENGIKDWASVKEYSKKQKKAADESKTDNIEWKQEDYVKYLKTQKMNDRERGYMLTALKGGEDTLAKDVQTAAEKGDYASVWNYYKAKAEGKSTKGMASKDTSSGALIGKGSNFSRVATPTQNKSSSSSSSGDKVNGVYVNSNKYSRYQSAAREIPSLDSSTNGYTNIYKKMDTSGNGKLNKAEVTAYIDRLSGYTESQKKALFNAYAASNWNNPY